MIATKLKNKVQEVLKDLYKVYDIEVDVSEPPQEEFGDLSTPVALSLQENIGKQPLDIAEEVAQKLKEEELSTVREITVTEPGFVNFWLKHKEVAKTLPSPTNFTSDTDKENITIEHTSINPNKSAHIGHLRNACLGDGLARLLDYTGQNVEVQNYIDDTGVQVADIILAEKEFETSWEQSDEDIPVDDFYWDLYVRIRKEMSENPELEKKRDEIMQKMDDPESEESLRALTLSRMIVTEHLETFDDFDIEYDLLVWERDILNSGLWSKTFEQLKESDAVKNPESGPHQGTWILEFGETEEENKVLVRSNGTATYTAKDIGYQMWKFGKTDVELPFTDCLFGDNKLISTLAGCGDEPSKAIRGDADQVINVIDVGQSYTQEVLKEALRKAGLETEAENSIHLAYEKVRLSTESLKELDIETDQQGDSLSMSGRKGIAVKIKDLVSKTIDFIEEKHPETNEDTAKKLAIGAIRYYLTKFKPNRVIVFDFDEALRISGDTGIYLQYAYARAHGILENIEEDIPEEINTVPDSLKKEEEALILNLDQFTETITKAEKDMDPTEICEYAFELAQRFASFYEECPVQTASEEVKIFRVNLVRKYIEILEKLLELTGIPAMKEI